MAHDDIDLEARMAQIRQMTAPVAFDAGFADRVMARLAQPRPLADGLSYAFVRLVPLAVAATLVLGALNLVNSRTSGLPLMDRVLGLQPVTLASAYTLNDAVGATTEGQQ